MAQCVVHVLKGLALPHAWSEGKLAAVTRARQAVPLSARSCHKKHDVCFQWVQNKDTRGYSPPPTRGADTCTLPAVNPVMLQELCCTDAQHCVDEMTSNMSSSTKRATEFCTSMYMCFCAPTVMDPDTTFALPASAAAAKQTAARHNNTTADITTFLGCKCMTARCHGWTYIRNVQSISIPIRAFEQ